MRKATLRSDIIDTLSLQDLCRFCQADEAWVIELVEYGVLDPKGSKAENWRFRGTSIVRAKKARRLNRDLGLNVAGVAINPGAEWSVDGDWGRNKFHLCFGHPSIDTIQSGVAKLAEICHREFGLPVRSANVER